jgi:hypothetical protein
MGTLSGPATACVLRRQRDVFKVAGFERLGDISVAHLYNPRNSAPYRAQRVVQTKTASRARTTSTRWPVVATVQTLSEAHLLPVVEQMLEQFRSRSWASTPTTAVSTSTTRWLECWTSCVHSGARGRARGPGPGSGLESCRRRSLRRGQVLNLARRTLTCRRGVCAQDSRPDPRYRPQVPTPCTQVPRYPRDPVGAWSAGEPGRDARETESQVAARRLAQRRRRTANGCDLRSSATPRRSAMSQK